MTVWRDDLGSAVELAAPARRVVSLVPSLTEAVARSAPGLLVGATDWCTHPADLAVTRVRGTKNPERAAIIALAPDLVLLPDEPYRFTPEDGPEEFPAHGVVLVPGRLLTWYGPSLATARADLLSLIR